MKNFQLCETSGEIPKQDEQEYIYELKVDGERIIAIKKGDVVQLWNRNRKTNEFQFLKNLQYPEVVEELQAQEHDFIIDGEMSCENIKDGLNIFNRRALTTNPLKIRYLINEIPIKFRVFDILEVDGKDITNLKLLERKNALNSFLIGTKHIEIVDYWFSFKEVWDYVKSNNLEGVIAKWKGSPYCFERNDNWLKIKNVGEMVVNVKTTPQYPDGYKQDSGRSKFGSLITDRCNVSLLTQLNKEYYFKKKPIKLMVKYYGIYPSGKLRNPVFLDWVK